MFRRIVKRVRKLFRRNNKVHPLNCTEEESSRHEDVAAQEVFQAELTNEDRIESPIEPSELTDKSLSEEWSDEEEAETLMDTIKGPHATYILVKEAVECLDSVQRSSRQTSSVIFGMRAEYRCVHSWSNLLLCDNCALTESRGNCQYAALIRESQKMAAMNSAGQNLHRGLIISLGLCFTDTSTDTECPEDSFPVEIHKEENAVAETIETAERLSLLSLLNWSDEEETADPDKEADKLSLLSLLSWPSEEETEAPDKEADRLSLLSFLNWRSEEESFEADRLSLLSHLSWPSEEETGDVDEEADRLSLLSLLSWPSEEEMTDIEEEEIADLAERFRLLRFRDSTSEEATEAPDKEADRLSLLSFLTWRSEEESYEADRLSLLSHLSWPSEEETGVVDEEADRLSLLSLLSWPSEEEMTDIEEEEIADLAERFRLLRFRDSTSESSEKYSSSGSSDVEPPMNIKVDVRPKLSLVESPEPINSTELESSKRQEEDSSDVDSSDVEPPMTIKIGEQFQQDERNKTSSDSSERAYCLEHALQAIANVTNGNLIQTPTCPENQSVMARDRRPSISQSSGEDFCLLSMLGEGRYGKVFLAEHKYTKKRVALKAITKDTSDPEVVEDIKREREIMELVKKEKAPFLLGLITSFESKYNECLVMDCATGGDLYHLLKKYDLPLECTRFYAACIVLGLKFLHEKNIVHRDLKTDNILLDKRGYPLISDYGISITGIGFGQKMSDICGTQVYMAPELFTSRYYTRSVDWWALGVIIYEMIFGKLPFDGEDGVETKSMIIYDTPEYSLTLPAHVRDILKGLLTKTPALRLGSTIEGAHAVMKRPFFHVSVGNFCCVI
ncbi:hypothetical protein XELAEV_18042721mg [Xenopus laevis]|uniref:Protein kinase domain-containing protein n=1 Tax=Xenopus laevis TaxID=8355 RepID=A0A974C5C7_XENLA|nr:hypothetical protein XELAEV_18042721mg [Xenopus laevis]